MNTSEKQTAVVVMPFSQELDSLYRAAIQPAIERCGLECVRLDEKCILGSMTGRMLHEISRAAIVVVEISNNNPNVLYELGYADALRKPAILVVHFHLENQVPFDIRDRQYIAYSDERDLQGKLKIRIPVVLAETDRYWDAFRTTYDRVTKLSGELTPFLLPLAKRHLEAWRVDIEALSRNNSVGMVF
jgi:hypothetical protein